MTKYVWYDFLPKNKVVKIVFTLQNIYSSGSVILIYKTLHQTGVTAIYKHVFYNWNNKKFISAYINLPTSGH